MNFVLTGALFNEKDKRPIYAKPLCTYSSKSDDDNDDSSSIDSKIECDDVIDHVDDDSIDEIDIDDLNDGPVWITKGKVVNGARIPLKRLIVSDDDLDNTLYFQCLGRYGRMCKTNDRNMKLRIINDKNNYFLCEFSPGHVRVFLDYDEKIPINLATKERLLQTLKLLLELLKHAMKSLGYPVPNDDVLMITESGGKVNDTMYKISFHVVINMPVYFTNSVQARQLMDKMHEYANSHKAYEDVSKNIDASVYSTDRPMRIIGHEKYDRDPNTKSPWMTLPTGRVMKAIDKDFNYLKVSEDDLFKYLMSHKDGEYTLIKDDDLIAKQNIVKPKVGKSDKSVKSGNKKVIAKDITTCPLDKEKLDALIELVRTKCPSAYFISYSNGFYQFQYKHGVDACPLGSKKHDNLGFYCTIKNDVVYAGCFSASCKAKKTIKIGNLAVKIANDIKKEHENRCKLFEQCIIENINEEYLSPLIKKRILALITDNKHINVCIKSPCGSGKTKTFQYVLPKFITKFRRKNIRDPKILIITTRITYLYDLKNNTLKDIEDDVDYIFHNYKDFDKSNKKEMKSKNGLIISLESLHHICLKPNEDSSMPIYDLVILDESESIFQQLFSSTIKKDKVENFRDFRDYILKPASKVLILDAGLSDSTIDMINIDNHLSKTVIIHNTCVKKSNMKVINVTNDKEEFYRKIKFSLNQLNNIIIVLCKRDLELIEWLKIYFGVDEDENEHFVSYTSDTGTIKKGELNNINVNWSKYRVVLYTTTVGAGMDYSADVDDFKLAGIENLTDDYVHFNQIFVIGHHDSIIHELMFQLIHRARMIKTNLVDILVPNSMNFATDLKIATMEDGIEHLKDVKGIRLERKEDIENGIIIGKIVIENYARLHARYLREILNTSKELWISALKVLAEEKSHQIIFDFKYIDKAKVMKKSQEKVNDASKRGMIVHADNIKTFHEDEKTTQKVWEDRKHSIIVAHGSSNASKVMINNIANRYTANENSIKSVMTYHIAYKLVFDYDTYIERIFNARKQLFDICKRAFGFDFTHGISISFDEFNRILKSIVFPSDLLRVLKKGTWKKFDNNIDILKSCLHSFGFTLISDTKQIRDKGSRKYVTTKYDIEPKSEIFELSRLQLNQLLSKNETLKKTLKSNEKIDKKELLTSDEKKSIETFNNLLQESGKYEKYVNYVSLINEISNLCDKKVINNDQKERLVLFLDGVKDYPSIDELFDECDIKRNALSDKPKTVKKLVNVKRAYATAKATRSSH